AVLARAGRQASIEAAGAVRVAGARRRQTLLVERAAVVAVVVEAGRAVGAGRAREAITARADREPGRVVAGAVVAAQPGLALHDRRTLVLTVAEVPGRARLADLAGVLGGALAEGLAARRHAAAVLAAADVLARGAARLAATLARTLFLS